MDAVDMMMDMGYMVYPVLWATVAAALNLQPDPNAMHM